MKKSNYLFISLLLIPFTLAQSIGTGFGSHTIVTKEDGIVYTWGLNDYGQLGNGDKQYYKRSSPVAVDVSGVLNGKTITAVAAGIWHSIALASDGTVYTWGRNDYGQLGNGNNDSINVPVAVNTSGVLKGKTITAVAAGLYHSIALADDGKVYTWGYNQFGQLGNGNKEWSNVPVTVTVSGVLSGKTITAVAAGVNHSIALASDGTVYTWGKNDYGQLGNENTESNVPVAVDTSGVLSGKRITAVAASIWHSIALASDGTVYTWGHNYYGQLGNGNNDDSNVPVAVDTSGVLSGKRITAIAAGSAHSIALSDTGIVYTWGANTEGQLGNMNITSSNVPVAVYHNYMGLLPVEAAPTVPKEFALEQNYPNPFNPSTMISYQLPMNNFVTLKVYNMLGQEVATLVNEQKPAGNYEVKFDASNLASGVYLYKLQAGEYNKTMKMILMK